VFGPIAYTLHLRMIPEVLRVKIGVVIGLPATRDHISHELLRFGVVVESLGDVFAVALLPTRNLFRFCVDAGLELVARVVLALIRLRALAPVRLQQKCVLLRQRQ